MPVVYIKEFDGKKIVQIASGPQHSLAIDSTGYVVSHDIHSYRSSVLAEWSTYGVIMDIVVSGWAIRSMH